MSTSYKLAVEIAEAIAAEVTPGKPKSRNRDEGIAWLASVIYAHIAPLVEDGARLRAALNIIPPVRLRFLAQYLDFDDSQKGIFENDVQTDLRILANAVDTLQARAQRPAQEGSES